MSEEPTIADLFAKDPHHLTRGEITSIVEYYRDNRVKFVAGLKAEKPASARAKKDPLPGLSLDDLEL